MKRLKDFLTNDYLIIRSYDTAVLLNSLLDEYCINNFDEPIQNFYHGGAIVCEISSGEIVQESALISHANKYYAVDIWEFEYTNLKKDDWVTITKSGDNWGDDMDMYINKTVQIRRIVNDRTIAFDGSGTWNFNFNERHFRKATQKEIANAFLKGEQVANKIVKTIDLGARVVRGRDWGFGTQDCDEHGKQSIGVIVENDGWTTDGWLMVDWTVGKYKGNAQTYRIGANEKYDLYYADVQLRHERIKILKHNKVNPKRKLVSFKEEQVKILKHS